MNYNNFCIVDLETDGVNPRECNPIEIAAVVVDARKLEIIEGSAFQAFMRPPEFERDDYLEQTAKTYEWHAEMQGCSVEDFLTKIRNSPDEKLVWKAFVEYTKQWYIPGESKKPMTAPILCGFNIINFDKIILQRLAEKYKNVNKNGEMNLFCPLFTLDIMHQVFLWQESLTMLPNYKMDTMRRIFNIETHRDVATGKAHEGLRDCYDEADLFMRCLKLNRRRASEIKGWY